jgi:hyperosmotically inducible protein
MNALSRLITTVAAVFCVACGQSDESITASVKTRFATDTAVNAAEINVTTQNRVVTLRGSVDTPVVKNQALRLTRETRGVRDVVDNLEIRPAVTSGALETSGRDATVKGAEAVAQSPVGDSAQTTGSAVGNAAKATGNAVVTGAKVAGEATVKGTKTATSATVKGAETAGSATVKGAEAVGSATLKGAEATASGVKKLGSGIAGAVTGGGDDKSAEKGQK